VLTADGLKPGTKNGILAGGPWEADLSKYPSELREAFESVKEQV